MTTIHSIEFIKSVDCGKTLVFVYHCTYYNSHSNVSFRCRQLQFRFLHIHCLQGWMCSTPFVEPFTFFNGTGWKKCNHLFSICVELIAFHYWWPSGVWPRLSLHFYQITFDRIKPTDGVQFSKYKIYFQPLQFVCDNLLLLSWFANGYWFSLLISLAHYFQQNISYIM